MGKAQKRPLAVLVVVLVAFGAASVALYSTTSSLDAWLPNIGTDALSIAITVTVIDRILTRRDRIRAGARIRQVLLRLRGDFFVTADFILWDYAHMHADAYEHPPAEFRALLEHFKEGLATRDKPWVADPLLLGAATSLAGHLEEQLQRHDRVLDHDFVAAAYRFIRGQRMSVNMYRDDDEHHDGDGWKTGALEGLVDQFLTLYNAFLVYARDNIEEPNVVLRDSALDSARGSGR